MANSLATPMAFIKSSFLRASKKRRAGPPILKLVYLFKETDFLRPGNIFFTFLKEFIGILINFTIKIEKGKEK
jgi:hypothetical protein